MSTLSTILALKTTSGLPMSGMGFETFASGLAIALDAFAPTVILMGQATGTAGVGAVSGTLYTTPSVSLCSSALEGSGIQGVIVPNLAILLSNVIAAVFTRPYVGTSPSVANGVDTAIVSTVNASLLNQLLLSNWGIRPLTTFLASAIAQAVQLMLTTSIGAGTVTGTPIFPPTASVGVTTSRI